MKDLFHTAGMGITFSFGVFIGASMCRFVAMRTLEKHNEDAIKHQDRVIALLESESQDICRIANCLENVIVQKAWGI